MLGILWRQQFQSLGLTTVGALCSPKITAQFNAFPEFSQNGVEEDFRGFVRSLSEIRGIDVLRHECTGFDATSAGSFLSRPKFLRCWMVKSKASEPGQSPRIRTGCRKRHFHLKVLNQGLRGWVASGF